MAEHKINWSKKLTNGRTVNDEDIPLDTHLNFKFLTVTSDSSSNFIRILKINFIATRLNARNQTGKQTVFLIQC